MLGAFSITPLGAGDSVGDIVAGCVRIVRDSGLDHETTAMFTTVEGEPVDVFAVIQRCIDYAAKHAPRVSVVAKFDHRPGHDDMLRAKVARVEAVLEAGTAPLDSRPEHD
ncbi:MAG: thiamine-binding protein [Nitriliruptoraceae bacterium]